MNDKKQEKTHKTAADAKIAHINEKRGRATKRRGGQFMLKTTGITGEREFQPTEWIIDEILPPGVGIIAAPPKSGKSWLILDICISVATGTPFWGYNVSQGKVVWFALEETERRIQDRVRKMGAYDKYTTEELDNLAFMEEYNRGLADGFIEDLDLHLSENPDVKLIVVDVFEIIRNTEGVANYTKDYKDINLLKIITKEYPHVAILLVHHTRKMKSDNPMENMSGSTGLTGASDVNFILESKLDIGETKARLTLSGKEPRPKRLNLEFNLENCRWECLGNHVESTQENEELAYIIDEFLVDEWGGTTAELVKELKKKDDKFPLGAVSLGVRLPKIENLLKNLYKIEFSKVRVTKSRSIKLKRI